MESYRDKNVPDLPADPLIDVPQLPWEVWRAPLNPPVAETVGITSPGHWSIGSMMTCQALQVGDDMPHGVVCSWTDEGITYILKKRSEPKVERKSEGGFLTTRFLNYHGAARAIWTLSPNVFCKVHSWTEGMTTEGETIRWVNQNVPSIPTTNLIHDWIDSAWNRSILICHRAPGKIYTDAWPNLTQQQRLHVADQVAGYLKALSKHTSDYIETATRSAPEGAWSLRIREPLPLWKSRIEPRVHRDDYEAYLKRLNDRAGIIRTPPGIGEPFVLSHWDCAPANFFVTTPSENEMPKVTAIIDWEGVNFGPKWHVAYVPRRDPHFTVPIEPLTYEANDWRWMLSNALVKVGFPLDVEYGIESVQKMHLREFPGLPIDWYFNRTNLPNGITL